MVCEILMWHSGQVLPELVVAAQPFWWFGDGETDPYVAQAAWIQRGTCVRYAESQGVENSGALPSMSGIGKLGSSVTCRYRVRWP